VRAAQQQRVGRAVRAGSPRIRPQTARRRDARACRKMIRKRRGKPDAIERVQNAGAGMSPV